MPITHTKVSTVADGSTTEHIRPSDWNANHTIAGTVVLSSGVASSAPLVMPAGTLLTTPSAGAIESDGTCFYATAASSGRQVLRAEQIITNTSAFTGTTLLTITKLFDASTGLNGAVTVGPSQTYMFETAFGITGNSTTSHTSSFGFGGTAAVDRQQWTAVVSVCTAASTSPLVANIVRATATNILHVASTAAVYHAFIQGKVVVGTSGTLIPGIVRSAGTANLVVSQDSYFRLWPIGSTAVNRVGHWS
jgi:hypothetical protein